MKNGIAFQLLFAVIFSMNKVNAQYVPMLKEGSEWAVHCTTLGWWNDYLTIGSPELIGNEWYHKVVNIYDEDYDISCGGNDEIYLREDSIAQKVYIWSPGFPDNSEYLYYDFSAEQNDTVYVFSDIDNEIKILFVDTIYQGFSEDLQMVPLLDLVNPKIILLRDLNENWNRYYWMEGIGSFAGILDGPIWEERNFMCHFNSEGVKDLDFGYNYDGEECTGAIGGNIGDIKNEIKLNIFPNPSSDIFNFESNRIIKEIMVFNSVGILLDHHQFNRFQTNLNLGHYSPSVYFCRILFDNGQKLHRMLILE
jgi:hypothetical protein